MRKSRRKVTQKNAEAVHTLRDAPGPNGSISITSMLGNKKAATL